MKPPKDVLGDRPDTPEEWADQNDRVARWLEKQAAEEAAKKFEEGQK